MGTLQNNWIFIVDDDPFWCRLLEKMLLNFEFTKILSFQNGTACIERLHLNPALVFLDHQMEDLNGLEVLQRIKEYYPGIGVVFCTAHEDLTVAMSAMNYGSYDYLLKQNANLTELKKLLSGYSNIFPQKNKQS
ncbi:MAG: response regulator [Niabella sp.]